jgi:uncharacterized protein (DUF58 family)
MELFYFYHMAFFDEYDLREISRLDLLAKKVVEGFIIGLHKSPFHGFSVEFAEHRLYNQGESTRDIDWKVYARTDKLFTKKFEEETNLRCQLVLDVSSSMFFPEMKPDGVEKINKVRFAALAAASLMNLLKRQRDAFGLSLFDETVIQHTPAKSSQSHYQLLLTYLEKFMYAGEKDKKTSAAESLHQIADRIHKRSLVIIFSDMFESGENEESLFSALQHLKHNKHEVILFHVTHKRLEEDFAFTNRPYEFIDMESGERVKLQAGQVQEYYQKSIKEYLHRLRQKCLQYRIDFVEADIEQGFYPILQAYLVKRSKMRV